MEEKLDLYYQNCSSKNGYIIANLNRYEKIAKNPILKISKEEENEFYNLYTSKNIYQGKKEKKNRRKIKKKKLFLIEKQKNKLIIRPINENVFFYKKQNFEEEEEKIENNISQTLHVMKTRKFTSKIEDKKKNSFSEISDGFLKRQFE